MNAQTEQRLDHRFLAAVRERLTLDTAPEARRDAVAHFNTLSLPDRKHEEWRFVRLRGLRDMALAPAHTDPLTVQPEQLARVFAEETAGRRIVFVDGVFAPHLSQLGQLAQGVTLSQLTGEADEYSVGELAAMVQDNQDYFVALHEALWSDGALLSVPRDTSAGAHEVVFVTTAREDSAMIFPRLLVHVAAGARATLVERHVALGDVACFEGAVAEIELEDNARLDHVKVQRSNLASTHIARTAVRLAEGAHYASATFNLGAALCRHDLHGEIAGGNTNCEMHGLAALEGRQVSDTHSVMNHVHPHAQSDQLHKCVVGDRAHAVFNGKIFVRQDAQQINAFQLNRNLLLSETARVDTKPQLEIFADDVKCSHGATIGQLDEDQLFYLQTRGIDPRAAKGLLTYAFAAEVLERVPVLSLRKELAAEIARKTS